MTFKLRLLLAKRGEKGQKQQIYFNPSTEIKFNLRIGSIYGCYYIDRCKLLILVMIYYNNGSPTDVPRTCPLGYIDAYVCSTLSMYVAK